MLFLNKTVIVNNLPAVCKILQNQPVIIPYCFYTERFAIVHEIHDHLNVVRIWKTNSFLDVWFNDYKKTNNFVGAVDYYEKKNRIQIDYISVNDSFNYGASNKPYKLSEDESQELMCSMVEYVKLVARKSNKPKITLSVHHNLRNYNKYFTQLGFALTDRKDAQNPFWIETEMLLENDNYIK